MVYVLYIDVNPKNHSKMKILFETKRLKEPASATLGAVLLWTGENLQALLFLKRGRVMEQERMTRKEIDDLFDNQINMLGVLSQCLENDNEDDDYLKLSPSARRGMIKIINDLYENLCENSGKIREHFPACVDA